LRIKVICQARVNRVLIYFLHVHLQLFNRRQLLFLDERRRLARNLLLKNLCFQQSDLKPDHLVCGQYKTHVCPQGPVLVNVTDGKYGQQDQQQNQAHNHKIHPAHRVF
jgi:hypothetical protein